MREEVDEGSYNRADAAVVGDDEGARVIEVGRLERHLHVTAVAVTSVGLVVGEVEGVDDVCGDIKGLVWFAA